MLDRRYSETGRGEKRCNGSNRSKGTLESLQPPSQVACLSNNHVPFEEERSFTRSFLRWFFPFQYHREKRNNQPKHSYLYIFRHIRFRGIYLVRIFRYENLVAEKMTIHKYNIWKSFFPLIEINNVIVIETLLARFVPCSEQVQSGTTHLA